MNNLKILFFAITFTFIGPAQSESKQEFIKTIEQQHQQIRDQMCGVDRLNLLRNHQNKIMEIDKKLANKEIDPKIQEELVVLRKQYVDNYHKESSVNNCK